MIVGLTGGIGMGKSTAAAIVRRAGIPVFDADRESHRLTAKGGAALAPLRLLAPEAIVDGALDRGALRAMIASRPALLGQVERIVHPLVRRARARMLLRARLARAPIVVLDIPLLFETGADAACDLVVVVSAPSDVQRSRLRRRGRMSEAEIDGLIARQMSDARKRRLADVVVPTGLSRADGVRRIRRLLRRLRSGSLLTEQS